MFICFNDESHIKTNCVGNFVIKEIYIYVFKYTSDFNYLKSIEHL